MCLIVINTRQHIVIIYIILIKYGKIYIYIFFSNKCQQIKEKLIKGVNSKNDCNKLSSH